MPKQPKKSKYGKLEGLFPPAREPAKQLCRQCGSQPRVLSAGILALYDLDLETRQYYLDIADGQKSTTKIETPSLVARLREAVDRLEQLGAPDKATKRRCKTRSKDRKVGLPPFEGSQQQALSSHL